MPTPGCDDGLDCGLEMCSGVDPSCVVESAAGNEDVGLVTSVGADLFASFLLSSVAAGASSFSSANGFVSLSAEALSTSPDNFLFSVLLSLSPLLASGASDDSVFSWSFSLLDFSSSLLLLTLLFLSLSLILLVAFLSLLPVNPIAYFLKESV